MEKNTKKKSSSSTLFNSKLFMNFDIKEENFDNCSSNTEESEIPSQKKLNQYLSKDLIDELDLENSSNLQENLNDNKKKTSFENNANYCSNKNNNYINKYTECQRQKIYKKIKREDWICIFCQNLNYSFRVKCNRCSANREISDFSLIQFLEQQRGIGYI